MNKIKLEIRYFASLREKRGLSREEIEGNWSSLREVYAEIQKQHGFDLGPDLVRPALSDRYVDWDQAPLDGQTLHLIPPVSGG